MYVRSVILDTYLITIVIYSYQLPMLIVPYAYRLYNFQ